MKIMINLTDAANIKLQKATTMKNNELTTIFIALTAGITVLAPMVFDKPLYGVFIISSTYGVVAYIMRWYLKLKYTEYSTEHLMFFSAQYFEEQLTTRPTLTNNPMAMLIVSEEIAQKFKLNGEKVFAALSCYY